MYVTLVEALYAENQINWIKVDVKKVEEWVGLYKTDQEGKTHEVLAAVVQGLRTSQGKDVKKNFEYKTWMTTTKNF